MKRRRAIAAVCACGLPPALAQRAPGAAVARLGILAGYPPPAAATFWAAFFAELGRRGWHEGRTLEVVARYSENHPEREPALASELVAARTQVVLCSGSSAVEAMRRATRSIPIVMVFVSDAVESGFVRALARPGGNVTGVTSLAGDMQAKSLDLLRTVRPELKVLGVMWSPGNPGSALALRDMEAVASERGVRVVSLPIERTGQVEAALEVARAQGVQALHVHPPEPIAAAGPALARWALEHRVATLGMAHWVRQGFLMSYWANIADLARIAASFVDRIPRGAAPATLPVEQPTRFDLVLNLKTARVIGVTIPSTLRLQADEVIE